MNQRTQSFDEQFLAAATVVAEADLIEICLHVLLAQMVVRADNRTLEQTPNRFNGVGMDIGADVFLGAMVDGFVVGKIVIARPFIGIELAVRIEIDILTDECVQCGLAVVFRKFQPNRPTTFDRAKDDRFGIVIMALASAASASADISLISLDNALQSSRQFFFHRSADAMAEIPGGFVATDGKHPVHLASGDALLGLAHQEGRKEPCFERQMGVVEDRPCGYAELIRALRALEFFLGVEPANGVAIAAWAANTFGPAQPLKQFAAPFLGRELTADLGEIHGNSSK